MKTRTRAEEEMMARTSALAVIEKATELLSILDVCARTGMHPKHMLKALTQLETMGVVAAVGGRFYARSLRAL